MPRSPAEAEAESRARAVPQGSGLRRPRHRRSPAPEREAGPGKRPGPLKAPGYNSAGTLAYPAELTLRFPEQAARPGAGAAARAARTDPRGAPP